MKDFLLVSVIASIALTLLLNLLPALFPNASRRTFEKIQDAMEDNSEPGKGPRIKVFFPWKLMILASIILTVFLNIGSLFR